MHMQSPDDKHRRLRVSMLTYRLGWQVDTVTNCSYPLSRLGREPSMLLTVVSPGSRLFRDWFREKQDDGTLADDIAKTIASNGNMYVFL
jgi:hypothetical protein